MGTGRTLNKNSHTRPVKSESERKRRQATQAQRLIDLGMNAEDVAAMNPAEIRTALKHPAKVKATAAPKTVATA